MSKTRRESALASRSTSRWRYRVSSSLSPCHLSGRGRTALDSMDNATTSTESSPGGSSPPRPSPRPSPPGRGRHGRPWRRRRGWPRSSGAGCRHSRLATWRRPACRGPGCSPPVRPRSPLHPSGCPVRGRRSARAAGPRCRSGRSATDRGRDRDGAARRAWPVAPPPARRRRTRARTRTRVALGAFLHLDPPRPLGRRSTCELGTVSLPTSGSSSRGTAECRRPCPACSHARTAPRSGRSPGHEIRCPLWSRGVPAPRDGDEARRTRVVEPARHGDARTWRPRGVTAIGG